MIVETEVNTDYTADEVRKAFKAIPKFGLFRNMFRKKGASLSTNNFATKLYSSFEESANFRQYLDRLTSQPASVVLAQFVPVMRGLCWQRTRRLHSRERPGASFAGQRPRR